MADARDSKSRAARRVGSTPTSGMMSLLQAGSSPAFLAALPLARSIANLCERV
jgi:hypothetical protein